MRKHNKAFAQRAHIESWPDTDDVRKVLQVAAARHTQRKTRASRAHTIVNSKPILAVRLMLAVPAVYGAY